MPLDGSDVASKPAGTTAVSGTTIESAKYNSLADDIYSILNTVRTIAKGYTGASTAQGAVDNFFDGTTVVDDDNLRISDPADRTKIGRFDAGNITTATTRIFTLPNGDGTLALLEQTQTFTGDKTFTGTTKLKGTTNLEGDTTETRTLQIGHGRSGNGYSLLDLVGDTTYSTYGFRVARNNTGANTQSDLIHRGTGAFRMRAQDAGTLQFLTQDTIRAVMTSAGSFGLGASTTPGRFFHIQGTNGAVIQARIDSNHATQSMLSFKSTATTSDSTVYCGANNDDFWIIANAALYLSTVQADQAISLPFGRLRFPATQNNSSNANELDDYEEGSWTPTVAFGGGSTGITYSNQTGRYVKVGRMLWVSCVCTLSNKGSSTGNVTVEGLPFLVNTLAASAPSGTNSGYTGLTGALQGSVSGTAIAILQSGSGGNNAITDAECTNSATFRFTAVYQTA